MTVDENTPCYVHGFNLRGRDVELAIDSQGHPQPEVHRFFSTAELTMQKENERLWLPAGHHVDLHIEHDHMVMTGDFVIVKDWRLCIHITVSAWNSVDAMRRVLHTKHAEVHFIIGGRDGVEHPVVIQCLPLNQYGKGLVHLQGRAETNRARVIQIEICATPSDIQSFTHYRALANLIWLITHGDHPRVPIAATIPRAFSNTTRYTDVGYQRTKGWHGHMHVPQNDHFDPTTAFKARTLLELTQTAPHDL